MEDKERELIRSNLNFLINHTECNLELLTFLLSEKILSFWDVEEIKQKKESGAKALQFYSIIQTRTDAYAALVKGLETTQQFGVLKILEKKADDVGLEFNRKLALKKLDCLFNLFPPIHSFTGRTRELEQLHQMILKNTESGARNITLISQVTTISGLGGIGKTQLAREYCRINAKEFNYNIIWLNAESESSLSDSFRRLASEKLMLSIKDCNGMDKSPAAIAEDVYKYFEGSKALFVLDDADATQWLKQFLPRFAMQNRQHYFLLTSRNREWDRGLECLFLGSLTLEEAVNLVQRGLNIEYNSKDNDNVEKLVLILQCFPLALQQAIAYISHQQILDDYSIEDYLKEFNTKTEKLLSFNNFDSIFDVDCMQTTYSTWNITMNKIFTEPMYGPLSHLILKITAYLSPDNIQRDLLVSVLTHMSSRISKAYTIDMEINKLNVQQALRLLVRYSMINGRKSQTILSVHRLVQAMTRINLSEGKEEEMILDSILKSLDKNLRNNPKANIPHVVCSWKYVWKYWELVKKYYDQIPMILTMFTVAGMYIAGEQFGVEALQMLEELFGKNNLYCLEVKTKLGMIFWEQDYERGAAYFETLLKDYNLSSYPDGVLIARVCFNIGHSLNKLGKYVESLSFLEGMYEKIKNDLGSQNHQTIQLLVEIGNAQFGLGHFEKALEIHSEVYGLLKTTYGETHYETLLARKNVAMDLFSSGNQQASLEILNEILNKMKYLGEDNYELINAKLDIVYALEQSEESLHLAVEVLQDCKKKLENMFGSEAKVSMEVSNNIERIQSNLTTE